MTALFFSDFCFLSEIYFLLLELFILVTSWFFLHIFSFSLTKREEKEKETKGHAHRLQSVKILHMALIKMD